MIPGAFGAKSWSVYELVLLVSPEAATVALAVPMMLPVVVPGKSAFVPVSWLFRISTERLWLTVP